MAPDGSEIHLPEELAREAFPDFFAAGDAPLEPPSPVPDIPLPSGPAAPEYTAEPDPVQAAQLQTPLEQTVAQGQLPQGVAKARTSREGYLPGPKTRKGLIDVESIGRAYDPIGQSQADNATIAEQGATDRTVAQLEQDEALLPFKQKQVELQRSFEQAEANRQAHAHEVMAQHEARIQQSIAEVPQSNPGRYWQSMDSFNSGMATLTMMLGGLQASRTGGANQVANFALELADRDMRSQEQNIATAKAKVGFATDTYGRASQQNYYDKLDLQETKALKLETLASGMEAEAAKFKSKFTQAAYLTEVAKIRSERDKILFDVTQARMGAMQKALTDNLQLEEQRASRAQQERHFKMSQDLQREQMNADKSKGEKENVAFVNDPQTGRSWVVDPRIAATMDKAEFGKVRDSLPRDASALAAAKRYVARMNEIGRIYGGWGKSTRFSPTGEEFIELGQLREKALNAIRHATAGANLTGFEIKNWEKILPNPTSTTSQGAVDDAVRFVELHGQEAQRKYINTYGLRDIGENGELTPVDLTKEWGNVSVEENDAPDAAELHTRMSETAKGIGLERPPARPDSFTPSEPKKGQAPTTYTGEGPQAKRTTPDSVRRLVKDAQTFRSYVGNAPNETGVTTDLVTNRIEALANEAFELDMSGYETEAQQLLDIRKELTDMLRTDYVNKQYVEDDLKELPRSGGRIQ